MVWTCNIFKSQLSSIISSQVYYEKMLQHSSAATSYRKKPVLFKITHYDGQVHGTLYRGKCEGRMWGNQVQTKQPYN